MHQLDSYLNATQIAWLIEVKITLLETSWGAQELTERLENLDQKNGQSPEEEVTPDM